VLRHDTLERHAAGLLQHQRAVHVEMLAVADRLAGGLRGCQQAPKLGLALEHRPIAQVSAVEIQQVEDVVDEGVAPALLEGGLQLREIGNAALVLDHDFTVDHGGLGRQLGDCGRDVGKLTRPIEAFAGEQLHVAVIEPSLNAVTVELDLVDPAGAGRRRAPQRGQRRRHEVRQRRAAGF